ncbi:ATP-binding protein [Marinilabilia salmonicolor]|uniref:histidine kinase n=1 Tax=Marinilabilia salmonicolor TaxID=989 RepID=A0A368UVC9_9BACT|nr:HAMP domain-containing sensor histidine kinase [Marinilabilia salmonicolor]RCW31314.1 histidine kinase/DNA gyrase B/HSP90-like ATPase [Marinilabilia salmonicolor]
MEIYSRKRWWKFLLMTGALVIGGASLFYTNKLTSELRREETRKMELWAKANRQFTRPDIDEQSLELVFEIIQNNTTVPLIIADKVDTIYFHRNLELPDKNQSAFLQQELRQMKQGREPIVIDLGNGQRQYLYYADSIILRKLRWFPLVQLFVVIVFVLLAYWAFSAARRWEQDQVWVGMAKETAHQLGTPTSSLLGWLELLEMKKVDPSLVGEMRHDIQRLQTITARFSKIGSRPELKNVDVTDMLHEVIGYLEHRISSGVEIRVEPPENMDTPGIRVNRPLFEWVVENISKNAADAMEGTGTLTFAWGIFKNQTFIDISDTGKGIARKNQKTIFKPGYTTKKRGWGLGLTLVRRIVEDYHNGRIFVKESSPGKGTTFRILVG